MTADKEQEEQGKATEYDKNLLPNLLPIYYKRLFPHQLFYQWLSYGQGDSPLFSNREICFTIENDIYIRYLSFDNEAELEKDINSRAPIKMDIGAIYSTCPKNHRTVPKMYPVERELVFDIDMSDYNTVRTCCHENKLCNLCWKFMVVAVRILDRGLREDFGFEHILWVFSGRRGIHGWVCDKDARELTNQGRTSVADYFSLISHITDSSNSQIGTVMANIGHHSVKRALAIIDEHFEEVILKDQNLFNSEEGISMLGRMIPDESIRGGVLKHFQDQGLKDSTEIWKAFLDFGRGKDLSNIVNKIKLVLMYPRLDINVSKSMNHLLKSPFVIHPETGKVCLPFNANAVQKFDPLTVPTITQLLYDIDKYDEARKDQTDGAEKSKIKEYRKTGMLKGVQVFEEFLRKINAKPKLQF